MNELIANARKQTKYKDWEFTTVLDFGALTLKEQAQVFNSHDILIMVHGAQMANAIFTKEGTKLIEVGCNIPSFLSAPTFLSLINGNYQPIQACTGWQLNSTVCMDCDNDGKKVHNLS
jgi:capsular polysaccharide biosynthesis protein